MKHPVPVRTAAAASSGLMLALGMPDPGLWWLGFLAWLPWLWAIEGRRPLAAFGYGLVTGVVFIGIAYFWMTELLMRFAEFPRPVAVAVHLVFSCWQGSIPGLAALLIAWVRRHGRRDVLWVAPVAWVTIEAFLPALFPTFLSVIWSSQPRLIQHAELGGAPMVTFSMVAINAALYMVLRARLEHRSWALRPAATLAAWLVAVPAYGTVRMRQVDAAIAEADQVRFGVVQGNFGVANYHDDDLQPTLLAEQQRITAQLEADGAQIALWGETSYPMTALSRERDEDFEEDDDYRIREGFSIPLVFGAKTYTSQDPYTWNSALVLHEDGTIRGRYDKVYPLLFGEAAPGFVDPSWYLQTIPNASHLNRGTGPGILEVDSRRFGPLICYEDVLPRYVRDVAAQEVHALLNLTNDSWFGRTSEQAGHLGLAVFRAVEHRRPLVRAVNAGISAYVDPAGRIVHQTRITDADVDGYEHAEGFVVDVPMIDPKWLTPYARTGESFNLAMLLLLAGLAWRRGPGQPPA